MSEANFLARLNQIFREELEQDDLEITMNTRQADLQDWDSLAHVRIVVSLERTFGVQLDVAEIETIDSVRGFYDAVCRRAS